VGGRGEEVEGVECGEKLAMKCSGDGERKDRKQKIREKGQRG
jgi:hypothetical protein